MYVRGYGHVQTHSQPTRAVKKAMGAVAHERGWTYDARPSGALISRRASGSWLLVVAYVTRNRGEPSDVSISGGVRLDRVAHVGVNPGSSDEPPVSEQALNVRDFQSGYLNEDGELFDYPSPATLTPLEDAIRAMVDYAEGATDLEFIVPTMLAKAREGGASAATFPQLEILVAGNPAWVREFGDIRKRQAQLYAEWIRNPSASVLR